MGRWAGLLVVTKEFREDAAAAPDKMVARMFRETAACQGYHPVSEPVLSWYAITQAEIDAEMAMNGAAHFRAGDWRVRGIVEVAEEAEI